MKKMKLNLLIFFSGNTLGMFNPNEMLLHAVSIAGPQSIDALILKGADINTTKKKTGQSALHLATAALNHKAVIHLLHHKSVNTNVKDYKGNTPLHTLAETANFCNDYAAIPIAQHLAAKGISVNNQNIFLETPLHVAVLKGFFASADLIKCLLELGAKIRISTHGTPLEMAIKDDDLSVDVITILLVRANKHMIQEALRQARQQYYAHKYSSIIKRERDQYIGKVLLYHQCIMDCLEKTFKGAPITSVEMNAICKMITYYAIS